MSNEEHDEIEPKGEPREGRQAGDALDDEEAVRTAEEARHGEEIAGQEDLSPKKRAKMLRKLTDEELVALAEEARKADHWLDVARRTQAELDNTVKRLKREHGDSLKYAKGPLAGDLLPIIDNLGRALAAGRESESFKGLYDGVNMTNKMFIDTLVRHGIEPIEAEGRKFDPNFHDALMTESREDVEDNVVTQELERGWRMGDRVLRATKVKVNKTS